MPDPAEGSRGERFADRAAAGRALAAAVARERDAEPEMWPDPIVLGLPRGGVPVAAVVASRLTAALDAVIVGKLRVPGRPELAMGAVAGWAGVAEVVVHEQVRSGYDIAAADLHHARAAALAALPALDDRYRDARPRPNLRGRCAVLVDDGLATGATMTAAVRLVRRLGAARVAVAVPVGAASFLRAMDAEADVTVCVLRPTPFTSVSVGYVDFRPTADDEVRAALR